ncbi:ankyrin repeat and SOCS box protein 13-like isoform X2 [Branchiostoma lanceolatum]|uniref:ankyrin repeat and SOCS box protein 13-like isoform X2 n=1 Tax=Branchiostoma lanceolatum TaxID=7740 RepID=UPI003456568F
MLRPKLGGAKSSKACLSVMEYLLEQIFGFIPHGDVYLRRGRGCDLDTDVGSWADRSPLHDAACYGRVLALKTLLDQGACANLSTIDSVTPLHEACLGGHAVCAKMLITAGAQVNARNIDGSTPLCDACSRGSVSCINLLLSHGAEVNPSLITASPLHEAVLRGHQDCVDILIENGARIEHTDCHHGTPLHVACIRGQVDCAKSLLLAGANPNATKNHETPLHYASQNNYAAVIQVLVEYGANITALNQNGKRALHLTAEDSEARQLLLYYEGHVESLKQLCRLTIRQSVGASRLNYLSSLKLPDLMLNFLCHR